MRSEVFLSVVSHDQGAMVNYLLSDILSHSSNIEVLVTSNVPETSPVKEVGLNNITKLENKIPAGFGANHNAAFQYCDRQFFCVANPDIRLYSTPFQELLACMNDPSVGLVAARVIDPVGNVEDSARYFPTPMGVVAKLLHIDDGRYPVEGDSPLAVDWVAGMFMMFRSEAFRDVGGFDEGFFLYYEDVDICARLWNSGWKVMLTPCVTVTHAAQRASRYNPRYFGWHLSSMMRYFSKHLGRLPSINRVP